MEEVVVAQNGVSVQDVAIKSTHVPSCVVIALDNGVLWWTHAFGCTWVHLASTGFI